MLVKHAVLQKYDDVGFDGQLGRFSLPAFGKNFILASLAGFDLYFKSGGDDECRAVCFFER